MPRTIPFVFDSGFDGATFRKMFTELGIRATVRLKFTDLRQRSRVVHKSDPPTQLGDLVGAMVPAIRFRVSRFNAKAKGPWIAKVAWRTGIRFVNRRGVTEKRPYSLVVVRGYKGKGDETMVLLTDDRVLTDAQARAVAERYFARWAVEDGHRLIKERFRLENLRVLTWRGLQRMVFLVHAAYAFMAWLVYRSDGETLAKRAPACGRVPKFPYYRIALALQAFLPSEP